MSKWKPLSRSAAPSRRSSYTCYLFEKGIDKILKKVGEECAETIIAAKNGDKDELVGEINDVFYHMMVMMNECGVTMEMSARKWTSAPRKSAT